MIKGYPLAIHRGTRQGSPLSPLLFVLAMEPLAIKIRNCPNVQRIECCDREHKCILFADDILMVISTITTPPNLYAILQPFSGILGLTINHDKSRALNISLQNSTQKTLEQSYKFHWQPEALPYLGIHLTPSLHTLYSHNYPALYGHSTAYLARWQLHPPSLFGRLHSEK